MCVCVWRVCVCVCACECVCVCVCVHVVCAYIPRHHSLATALKRVWDPPSWLPACLEPRGREIFDDRKHGAAEVALWSAELVALGAGWEQVAALRPSMVATVNAAEAAGAAEGRGGDLDVAGAMQAATGRAVQQATALLREGARVATFSRSSTILRCVALVVLLQPPRVCAHGCACVRVR